ncbi:PREDICTED: F-box protein DOR-like [Camelina sativa]|uniref:F-box protein DOR-like n=1 Tax=Camelina sativa TaxID=90675 RepID=A0ABM1Q702_CAMSA|nr:PREDICTED: F-box protein DOR-like [Camelina sativa]
MKSKRQNVSESRQTILGSHSTSSDENSESIPIDLIIDIFLRLPVKSIARCRCVSKLWEKSLRLPYFTELYLTRSSAHPRLLFVCEIYNELLSFSTPQTQNLCESSSSSVAPSYHHMKFPLYSCYGIISPINGLVFTSGRQILKGRKISKLVSVICNPSTGESLTLPKPQTRKKISIRSYFGYDPIEKQFKVLSMTRSGDGSYKEHQVLTLGTENPTWRMIDCGITHRLSSFDDVICINGLMYFLDSDHMIVCFDVRSEKFSFIKTSFDRSSRTVMINYNGKLASLMSEGCIYNSGRGRRFDNYITGTSTSLEMWVLEDAGKHEWSKHIYELPPLWKNVLEKHTFVGVAGTNELVLSPCYASHPFYVFYYNFETKTIRRVEIEGSFKELTSNRFFEVSILLGHVEDVKLMKCSDTS